VAIVVSDTSPIRALHHLGLLAVLNQLYGDVLVPPAVASELGRGSASCSSVPIERFAFIQVTAPLSIPRSLSVEDVLDAGEVEAISLALERKADVLLMDEREGRRVATEQGLSVVGALGVLLRAKRAGLIPMVRPLAERLRSELRFTFPSGS
jgi:uncharacterized protein